MSYSRSYEEELVRLTDCYRFSDAYIKYAKQNGVAQYDTQNGYPIVTLHNRIGVFKREDGHECVAVDQSTHFNHIWG